MKKIRQLIAVVHLVILLALIYWNYYSNTGAINHQTVGDVSDKFDNLFTPAGYAFAIWGLIYLGLLVLGVYWIYLAFKKDEDTRSIVYAAPTLILAHFGNGMWLWFWLNEATGSALMIMIFILAMLFLTSIRLDAGLMGSSKINKLLIRVPVSLYFGWISVATIANVAAHLKGIGWNGGINETMWTMLAIVLATILGSFMVIHRNRWVFGLVIIWALIAIAVRHFFDVELIMWTAIVGAICVAASYLVNVFQLNKTNQGK